MPPGVKNPMTNEYVTTAAATAMTMRSSVAMIGDTPFRFSFKVFILFFSLIL